MESGLFFVAAAPHADVAPPPPSAVSSASVVTLRCASCGGLQHVSSPSSQEQHDTGHPSSGSPLSYGPLRCQQCSRLSFMQRADAKSTASFVRENSQERQEGWHQHRRQQQQSAAILRTADYQQHDSEQHHRTPSPPPQRGGMSDHHHHEAVTDAASPPFWWSAGRRPTGTTATSSPSGEGRRYQQQLDPHNPSPEYRHAISYSAETYSGDQRGLLWGSPSSGGGAVMASPYERRQQQLHHSSWTAATAARSPPNMSVPLPVVAASPSIVFRRRSMAVHQPTPSAAIVSAEHGGSWIDDERSHGLGSSAQKVAAMLSRRAAALPRTSPPPAFNNEVRAAASASSTKVALELMRKNRERLAYRYFQGWIIWSTRRQSRSVFRNRAGQSGGRGTPAVAAQSTSRSDTTIRDMVTSLIAAQDAHAANVRGILLSIGGATGGVDNVNTVHHQQQQQHVVATSTGGPAMETEMSPTSARRARAQSLLLTTPAAAGVRGATTANSGGGERPLSALVRAQAAQALTVLPRQEDVARRELYREELEYREEFELYFHASRRTASVQESGYTPRPSDQLSPQRGEGGSAAASSSRRPYGSTVSQLVQHYDDRERISQRDTTQAIAATAQKTIAARELELELARLVGKESSTRKLTAAAESNASVTLFADLQQRFEAAAVRDAEGRRGRQSTSESLARRLSSMSGASTSQRRSNDEEQQLQKGSTTATALSSSTSFRNRSVSFSGSGGADGPTTIARGATVQQRDSDADISRNATSSSSPSRPASRARSFTSAPVSAGETAQPRSNNAATHETTGLTGSSPSPARRRAQSLVPTATLDADVTGPLLSAELKGRKGVIKSYKLGLENIIEHFAGQAATLSS
ncbi:Hypothetical protein, putative [Bodo saltans]|uniref:Uncharacterized protein n=1 Tax=Bodo saltans TaxID=75058 RepID=A0A0S4IV86_BODSA|nr:Hypothetical protein, putative [Bodo saltans]|eukprot:CUF98581.1 Hypothetical protein, putative [Bodo saltans]